MNRRTQGFTLIEMMVVVAIIGILAATSIPSYRIYLNQARLLSAELTIRQAILDYTFDKEYSPAMIEDLVTDGYLSAIPNDPWTETGSSLLASNDALKISSAYAATGTLGIEEAGDWFYSNDGQNIYFYAKSHPGRIYQFPSYGLPPMSTPAVSQPATGSSSTPAASQDTSASGTQQSGTSDSQSDKKSKDKESKSKKDEKKSSDRKKDKD